MYAHVCTHGGYTDLMFASVLLYQQMYTCTYIVHTCMCVCLLHVTEVRGVGCMWGGGSGRGVEGRGPTWVRDEGLRLLLMIASVNTGCHG